MNVSIEPLSSGPGVEIIDSIERHRYSLATPGPVSPTPATTDAIPYPVDAAARIETTTLTFPAVAVYVRDSAGRVVAQAESTTRQELPEGAYTIELCAPIKLYLRVESAVTVAADTERTYLEFGEETDVAIGARSHHEHPAGTITTTDDPQDLMTAVSAFGSALKTTSPERSYPTLRGHPPLVELGDELHVPEELEPPETGIEIRIPETYRAILVAAPLAYYLGARLVPGDAPTLVTAEGFEHELDGARGFEDEVERVLKQTFLLDCLTRTEGIYPVDLHEREQIEADVDLDFAALYGASIGERTEAYLSVPYETVAAHVPEWKLTTHVVPAAGSVETLPFVVNDLAVVKTPRTRPVSRSDLTAAVDEFFRDEPTRSTAEIPSGGSYVRPTETGSLEQAWIGDETPVGASKATVEAFHNRLARSPDDGDITISVVCNDAAMDEERDVVDDVYGSRAELPFDVEIHRDLTVDELRGTLSARTDFLHYIGHIDAEGFQCADGKLDAAELDSTGVDAFLLNACASYEQGLELIEAGAIGGVVTLSDVINSGAVRIGKAMARLLDRGFPLQAALTVAREESLVGGQYIVVGDGGLAVTQPESGIPCLCEIETGDDDFAVTYRTFPTSQAGMGSLVMVNIDGNESYDLSSGNRTFSVSERRLIEFLRIEDVPLLFDGQLRWRDDLVPELASVIDQGPHTT